MNPPTEPETLLRLTFERMMAGDPRNGLPEAGGDVGAVGRAVMAAGLLDEQAVMAVVHEYALAISLRTRQANLRFRLGRFAEGEREDLSSQRVVVRDFDIETSQRRLTVNKIVFTEDHTRVDAVGTWSRRDLAGGGGPRAHRPRIGAPSPGTLMLRDDQGTAASATPHGWGSGGASWQASFRSNQPLSVRTAWIEVDGVRIELPPAAAGTTVRVEARETLNPLTEALRREIISGLDGHSSLEAFISALVELGAAGPDDPDIAEARRVAAGLQSGTPPQDVGPPWDAALQRIAAKDGPVGYLSIGASVGSVADHSIRFDALASEAEGFSVDVAVSPGTALLMRHFPGFRLDPAPIIWWAEDDTGNVYLGAADHGGGGGSSSSAEGTIAFMSPLDPKATRLELIPTFRRERAVVSLPLDGLRSPS